VPLRGQAELPPGPSAERLRQAVERGLKVVAKAARSYPEHRSCFSCHHQTLPVLAMVSARDRGLPADIQLLELQADFTHASFTKHIRDMNRGKGIGGTSMTVGYGLWTLHLLGRERDETTAAMVAYLLLNQESDGRWRRYTSRPPLEDSDLTCTVLAIQYLEKYAEEQQRDAVAAAIARGRAWLLEAQPGSQEDRNSLLGGLALRRAEAERVQAARQAVLAAQGADGGWAQLPGGMSDAYATGQTLFTLRKSGLPASHAAFRRGVEFLLATQEEDGSWFVASRSKPIQTFFDNGDPHGKDQFISIPATSWAVTALALALEGAGPPPPAEQGTGRRLRL
jgi:N-acyl-D-amino-acid deacylase